MICAIFFDATIYGLCRPKSKSSSNVSNAGGNLAFGETLSQPALQMPNGKGQRKQASGGDKSGRYKQIALLRGASRKERAKWSRGFYKGRSNERKSDGNLLRSKMCAPVAVPTDTA